MFLYRVDRINRKLGRDFNRFNFNRIVVFYEQMDVVVEVIFFWFGVEWSIFVISYDKWNFFVGVVLVDVDVVEDFKGVVFFYKFEKFFGIRGVKGVFIVWFWIVGWCVYDYDWFFFVFFCFFKFFFQLCLLFIGEFVVVYNVVGKDVVVVFEVEGVVSWVEVVMVDVDVFFIVFVVFNGYEYWFVLFLGFYKFFLLVNCV